MRRSRSVTLAALALSGVLAVSCAAESRAQSYDAILRSLGLSTDVPRSARLLGMGGLSFSVPDRDQDITLWNFAGSPVGVASQDTASTLELRPSTASVSGAHDGLLGQRQDLAGRASRMPFEMFRRDGKGNAFGMTGELSSVRRDVPFSDVEEVRSSIGLPRVDPILTGPFPYFGHGKVHFALRGEFSDQHGTDEYRSILDNAAGQFLSLDGETLNPPSFFVATDTRVRRTAAGVAASYALGASHWIALGFDGVQDRWFATNPGQRYESQESEKRPYGIGQATLIGHFGKSIQYGVDGRAWTSTSQQNWAFTLSGGIGGTPLDGRGKLLTRKEEGSLLNTRVNWTLGALQLGGLYHTNAGKVTITAPDVSDLTSFNYFLDQLYYVQGADTLAKPDSVIGSEAREFAQSWAIGGSLKVPRGILGVEYHRARDLFTGTVSGQGPRRLAWDVRAGWEFRCNEIITGRVGSGYRWVDYDTFTKLNEYRGASGSLGLGVHPRGASWTFDAGYSLELMNSDFNDPMQQRSTRQQLATTLRWGF